MSNCDFCSNFMFGSLIVYVYLHDAFVTCNVYFVTALGMGRVGRAYGSPKRPVDDKTKSLSPLKPLHTPHAPPHSHRYPI